MAEPLTVEKLAEAVREHEQLPLSITYATYPGCTCGWLYPATPRGEAMRGGDRDTDAWEKHQQEVLRPLVEAERARVRAEVAEEIALVLSAEAESFEPGPVHGVLWTAAHLAREHAKDRTAATGEPTDV